MIYTLTLEQAEVQVLLHALGELPLKMTLATFAKVQKQVAEQDEAAAIEVNNVGK